MKRPWISDHEIPATVARHLIETQFVELAPARLATLGIGWDNAAYCVNDAYVFRFPRRQLAVELLHSEQRVLPAIAARLSLPIPIPEFQGRPQGDYPWPFCGYRLLAGRTACTAALTERQRQRAAAPLAEFLKTLHAISADEALRLGAPVDTLGRLDLERRIPQLRERLDTLLAENFIENPRPLYALLDTAVNTRVPLTACLAHGDLYVRHILVDENDALCGVIDWGDVHVGDPAVDLAMVYGFLPPIARAEFYRVYGFVDEDTRLLARFRALSYAAILALYGRDIGDGDLVREAHIAFGYLAEERNDV